MSESPREQRDKRIAVLADTISATSAKLVSALAEHRQLAEIESEARRNASSARGRVTTAQAELAEAQGELKRLADESLR